MTPASLFLIFPAIVFLWVGAFNWIVAWHQHVLRRRAGSWTPLIAGVCGAIVFWNSGSVWLREHWWVPFLLDYGSVIGLTFTAVWHVRRLVRHQA